MSKLFLKMPKGTSMLFLVAASALKNIFAAEMSINLMTNNFGMQVNYLIFIMTVLLSGLIMALVVRLVILFGYKITNKIHIRMTAPSFSYEERMFPINYTDLRKIIMGYMASAYLVSALLNIPMYLFPISYSLCLLIGLAIELVFIGVMAWDIQNMVAPHKCKKAFVAFALPFGLILALRLLVLGV